jgi:hypothetical protein
VYPPPTPVVDPPIAAPLPNTPEGKLPTCQLAEGDDKQWFVIKLPKRPESNITFVAQGKGYMVSELGSEEVADLKFENNDISIKSPLAATLAYEESSALLKIKYSQSQNGFDTHGLLVVDGGVGFWLFSSEPIGTVAEMTSTNCAASYLCIPVGSSYDSDASGNLAEVDNIVTFLATLKVTVDASASVVPTWASNRLPTQQLMSQTTLDYAVASAFWLSDNSVGTSRIRTRAVAGSPLLQAKYNVHEKIFKPYTPGLDNLVVGKISSTTDIPPIVRCRISNKR